MSFSSKSGHGGGGGGQQQPNMNLQQRKSDILSQQLLMQQQQLQQQQQQQQQHHVPSAVMQATAAPQHSPNARLLSASMPMLQQYQNQQMATLQQTARFLQHQQTFYQLQQAQQQHHSAGSGISGSISAGGPINGNLSDVQKLIPPALLSIFQQAQRMQLNSSGPSLDNNSTGGIHSVLSNSSQVPVNSAAPAVVPNNSTTGTAAHVAAVPNFIAGNPNKPFPSGPLPMIHSAATVQAATAAPSQPAPPPPPSPPNSVASAKATGGLGFVLPVVAVSSAALMTLSQQEKTVSLPDNGSLESHAKTKLTDTPKKSSTDRTISGQVLHLQKPTVAINSSAGKQSATVLASTTISIAADTTLTTHHTESATSADTSQKSISTVHTKELISLSSAATLPLTIETVSTPIKGSPKASSPRTKQTPRKSSNPLKASAISPMVPAMPLIKTPTKVTPSNTNTPTLVMPAVESLSPLLLSPCGSRPITDTSTVTRTLTKMSALPTTSINLPVTNNPEKLSILKATIPAQTSLPALAVLVASSATTNVATTSSAQCPEETNAPKALLLPANNTNKIAKTVNTPIAAINQPDSANKRHRAKTILYQSPTPELTLVTKLSVSEANASAQKSIEDRLVLFYKHEFLAVRNAENGFFLCQTMHNVYKSSPRIRILWLSEIAGETGTYKLDFYDTTDIECVLTSLDLARLDKSNYLLTAKERDRIENILKKAIDVETGVVPRPTVTEENPDGLDLSLYKNESQIEKKVIFTGSSTTATSTAKPNKRKLTERPMMTPKSNTVKRARRRTSAAYSSPVSSVNTPSSSPRSKKRVSRKGNRTVDSEDDKDADYRPSVKKAARSSFTPVAAKTSKRISMSVSTPESAGPESSNISGRENRANRRDVSEIPAATNKTTETEKKVSVEKKSRTGIEKKPSVDKRAPTNETKAMEKKEIDVAAKKTVTKEKPAEIMNIEDSSCSSSDSQDSDDAPLAKKPTKLKAAVTATVVGAGTIISANLGQNKRKANFGK